MGAMLMRNQPMGPSAVRRELSVDLNQHGVPADCIDDVALVATELVGNAIRHSGVADDAQLDVCWTVWPDEVLVSVEDPSCTVPVERVACPGADSGRGLTIIAALSIAWGVEPTQHGKRVWARVRVPYA